MIMMPYSLNPKPFFLETEVDASTREYMPVTSIREFANEFGNSIRIAATETEIGNRIKITIEGPNSISENILTPREFDQLRSTLVDYNMTSNLTRVDLMDSDYARDVMHIVPAKVTAVYSSGNCAAHEETVEVEYPEFTYIAKRQRVAGRNEVAKAGEPVAITDGMVEAFKRELRRYINHDDAAYRAALTAAIAASQPSPST